MPISHKSIIHQPIGYTPPVDLNLLGRVLQFKQAQFDSGVAKTQSTIDNIASLDVVKDEDRQYLNAKLTNLVSTVNSIGGADYSDPNVINQIGGLSSQIYGDDKIINAVGNTKKFRYTQGFYKDLKEKKPKDWNPANEWFDMGKFSKWLSDGQVGSSPDLGAGSVTPYNKYEEDWQKMFNNIVQSANITTEITDKGLMYRVDSHKLVSPERIWEIAQRMLDPGQRQQIGIEGRYTYGNIPLPQLVKAYDQQTYDKIAEAQGQLQDYQTKLKGASSITDQEKYEKLINEKQSELNSLVEPVRKGQEQIKESIYLNDKLKGLAARYSFNQSTTKLQPATDKMFKLRYEMDKQRLYLDANKFGYQQQKDTLDREADLAIAGMRLFVDPLTKLRTYIRDPRLAKPGEADYSGIPGLNNAGEAQTSTFTKEKLDDRKTSLVTANNQLFMDFVREYGRKRGLSDIIVSDLMDDGNIQGVIDPDMKKAAEQMMATWNAMTRGEKINYDNLDPLFKSFVGKYQTNLKEVEAIDTYYSNVDKTIRTKYGITDEAMAGYQEYQAAQEQYRKALSMPNNPVFDMTDRSMKTPLDRAQENLARVVGKYKILSATPAFSVPNINAYNQNRNTERDVLIASADKVFNLPNLPIADDKKDNLKKMIASNAGTLEFYDEQGKSIDKSTLNFETIEPMNKGYAYIETDAGMARKPVITFKMKTGTKPEDYVIGRVPLTPIQQQALGFGTDIQDLAGFSFGLMVNGEVKGINTTAGQSYDLQYDLVKYHPEDQDDTSVFLRVHKGNNIISLYNRPFPSYEQAVQFMEGASRQKTAEDAFSFLTEMAK